MRIFYTQPAKSWKECIPIGNGKFGGMIFGGVEKDQICLNEDSIWSGYPGMKQEKTAYETKIKYLEEVRSAVAEENYGGAESLLEEHLLGEFTESYLPIGKIHIEIPSLSKIYEENNAQYLYERELDLEEGIARVFTETGKGKIKKEYFCSYPDQCMVIRIESEQELQEINISLESELKHNGIVPLKRQGIEYCLQCPEHVDPNYVKNEKPIQWGERGKRFGLYVRVIESDGNIECRENILIKNARNITIILTVVEDHEIATSYVELKRRHVEDYKGLYGRVELYLGEQPEIPTDKRLEAIRMGKEDTPFYALYFQYGRYLLISSSRGTKSFPANLQGIWSWEMQSPWSSNWTTNINVQMNYWLTCKCNLSECLNPYIEWMKKLSESGVETAQKYFGCRGYSINHNVDMWYSSNPVGIPFGSKKSHEGSSEYAWFPLAGVWLCQEIWRVYEYHPDSHFLEDTVLPLLQGAVMFCVDWLIPWEGYYVTNPSTSPEHRFEDPNEPGIYRSVSMASTIDMTLIKEVFKNYRKALDCSQKTKTEIAEKLLEEIGRIEPKLYPFHIGVDGRLQEWYKDFREKEKGHRHLSHLYGLFPGELFCGDKNLTEAAKKSLEYRMKNGSGNTGWSCAWAAELYAVLGDGENTLLCLKRLLEKSTYDNLWDAHPPMFFQIDGNFGATSAIADMLIQDRGEKVTVLPALPKEWKNGYVRGLRVKGNKSVDIVWEDGIVTEYLLKENELSLF